MSTRHALAKALLSTSLLSLPLLSACNDYDRPGSGPLTSQGGDRPDAIPAGGRLNDTFTTPGEYHRDGVIDTPMHGEPGEPPRTGDQAPPITPMEERNNPKSPDVRQ